MNRCNWLGHKESESQTGHWDYKCPVCGKYWDKDYKFKETWWATFWEDYSTVVWLLLIAGVVIVSLFSFMFFSMHSACNSYVDMGIPAKWTGIWTGCMANHPEFGWVPVDKYFEILNLYIP